MFPDDNGFLSKFILLLVKTIQRQMPLLSKDSDCFGFGFTYSLCFELLAEHWNAAGLSKQTWWKEIQSLPRFQ